MEEPRNTPKTRNCGEKPRGPERSHGPDRAHWIVNGIPGLQKQEIRSCSSVLLSSQMLASREEISGGQTDQFIGARGPRGPQCRDQPPALGGDLPAVGARTLSGDGAQAGGKHSIGAGLRGLTEQPSAMGCGKRSQCTRTERSSCQQGTHSPVPRSHL